MKYPTDKYGDQTDCRALYDRETHECALLRARITEIERENAAISHLLTAQGLHIEELEKALRDKHLAGLLEEYESRDR